MRPAHEVAERVVRYDLEISAELTDDLLDAIPIWDLEDKSAEANDLMVKLAGAHGCDAPGVTRLVVLKRRLNAAIEKRLSEMFPPTA